VVTEVVFQRENYIVKKIAPSSECALVLVGNVDLFPEPIMVFVRLKESVKMPDVTSAPVPIRFIVLFLGPECPSASEAAFVHLFDQSTHNRGMSDDSSGPAMVNRTPINLYDIARTFSSMFMFKMFAHACFLAQYPGDLTMAMKLFLEQCLILQPGAYERENILSTLNEIRAKAKVKQRMATLHENAVIQANGESVLVGSICTTNQSPNNSAAAPSKHYHSPHFHPRPVPAAEYPRHTLKFTGKLFGGLKLDIKHRFSEYKADWVDGCKCFCIAAMFFLYFSIMVPEVTFGANLSSLTKNKLKVETTLVGAGVCGSLFALLGGQPLLIVGTTGPIVLFEKILYDTAEEVWPDDIQKYFQLRFWSGIWTFAFCFIAAMLDLSYLIRMFTRFSEEIFASLIGTIFIYEAIKWVVEMFERRLCEINDCCLTQTYDYMLKGCQQNSSNRFRKAPQFIGDRYKPNGHMMIAAITPSNETLLRLIRGDHSSLDRDDSDINFKGCPKYPDSTYLSCAQEHYRPDEAFFDLTIFCTVIFVAFGLDAFRCSSYLPLR
ncbi:sodium-driven chloride bicarbonate exchanger-like, partial [Convolutriloba macropyga]|uniref:sodium-driven chloride bicarbonate exchanger-like n=1 Tax=Convolutriloba macropyga TaxID=536237 RepID=UPI003F5208D5